MNFVLALNSLNSNSFSWVMVGIPIGVIFIMLIDISLLNMQNDLIKKYREIITEHITKKEKGKKK